MTIYALRTQRGTTLVELMVALAIGSFLMIGAVQIYNQSRQAFVVNDSIARVQETAQFAMDVIEQDIRMASNWGRTSRSLAIEGRSIDGNENPSSLTVPATCGVPWVWISHSLLTATTTPMASPAHRQAQQWPIQT